VVANLLLEPHEVYVVPETTLPLRLLQVKHGKIHGINITSNGFDIRESPGFIMLHVCLFSC
jgi:hypothetical protein